MAISDKSRKLLWGRSGNRCAYCRRTLAIDGNDIDDPSVVGDEAHIVAREPNGPRGQSTLSLEDRDEYANLVLLCKVHHKLVDDQPGTYTCEMLTEIKTNHEAWVHTATSPNSRFVRENDPFLARRIRLGKEILGIVSGCHAGKYDLDPPHNEEEIYLLGGFNQSIQDYLDIVDELGVISRMQAEFSTTEELKELDLKGFAVYACTRVEPMNMTNGNSDGADMWSVAVVVVLRKTNPRAKRKAEEVEAIFDPGGNEQDECSNFLVLRM